MRVLSTMAIGLIGGGLFLVASIPLPWLLGSMTLVALISIFQLTPLKMPGRWREIAMAGIGTALGAGFSTETLSHIAEWRWSLSAMLALSVLFCVAAVAILRKWSDMSRMTSFLSGVPGSISLVSALSEDYGADTRRVALSHSARLIALLTMTPILLHLTTDADLVSASRNALLTVPVLDPIGTPLAFAAGLLGLYLGKRSGIPAGTLMVPLMISASLHLSGIIKTPLPGLVAVLSQVVIGIGIGLRFNGYRIGDILRDGWLSILIGIALSILAFVGAHATAELTGLAILPLLLSFLPGGAPELGAVAIALHADPAMVAGHHFARLVVILVIVPIVAKKVRFASA